MTELPTPVEDAEPSPRAGLRSLVRFGRDIGRFVRLAEAQGTRLVDVLERWVHVAEETNRIYARQARALERLADAVGGQEEDDG